MRWKSHVRFGGRAGETDQQECWHRAPVRPYRQFAQWCEKHRLHLFAARRADIECFGRALEARGRARATVSRRLSTIAGFYRYAVEEELLDTPRPSTCGARGWTMSPTPPASTVTSWASCWWPPGSGRHQQDALISLLALNGLRV